MPHAGLSLIPDHYWKNMAISHKSWYCFILEEFHFGFSIKLFDLWKNSYV